MNDHIGRNDPCPCGSGKKYKRCCMPRPKKMKDESNFSPKFRFEPGSYGSSDAFVPSIACLKQTESNEWNYYFVLAKPREVHIEEDDAVLEAENDLNMAFLQKEKAGSDFAVAEYLRAQGYFNIEGFEIIKE